MILMILMCIVTVGIFFCKNDNPILPLDAGKTPLAINVYAYNNDIVTHCEQLNSTSNSAI